MAIMSGMLTREFRLCATDAKEPEETEVAGKREDCTTRSIGQSGLIGGLG